VSRHDPPPQQSAGHRPAIDPEDVEQALALLGDFVHARLNGEANKGELEFVAETGAINPEAAAPAGAAARARLNLAKAMLIGRQLRLSYFEANLFGEPSHDMLLGLYIQQSQARSPTVDSLRLISGVPATTALRWIDMLSTGGILERIDDPADRERDLVRLTDDAFDRMTRYLDAVIRQTASFWTPSAALPAAGAIDGTLTLLA
jgi:DNA-binding MarR family transcriptional regulator